MIANTSGAVYAMRTMAALLERECHLEVVISEFGRRLLHDELGDKAAVPRLREYLVETYGQSAAKGTFTVLNNKDLGATLASGSHECEGMVIVPCSMGTLAAIAAGTSRSLVERAADVALKERRPLLLVTRETPLSAIHLENMLRVTRAGAIVMPAAPGFYHRPERVDDLVDFIVARALDHLGVEAKVGARWSGSKSG